MTVYNIQRIDTFSSLVEILNEMELLENGVLVMVFTAS